MYSFSKINEECIVKWEDIHHSICQGLILFIFKPRLNSKIPLMGNNKILVFKIGHNSKGLGSRFPNSKDSNNQVPISQDSNNLDFNLVLSSPNPSHKILTNIHNMEVKEVRMLLIFDDKYNLSFNFG